MSQPVPNRTAPRSLTVSHNASAHHGKRGPYTLMLRVYYGSVDQHAEAPSDAGHSPSYTITPRDSSPIAVEESTPCVCISMSLSNPNHTTQVCLRNTPVFQTIQTRKHTI